jgi:hypothetical protein
LSIRKSSRTLLHKGITGQGKEEKKTVIAITKKPDKQLQTKQQYKVVHFKVQTAAIFLVQKGKEMAGVLLWYTVVTLFIPNLHVIEKIASHHDLNGFSSI